MGIGVQRAIGNNVTFKPWFNGSDKRTLKVSRMARRFYGLLGALATTTKC